MWAVKLFIEKGDLRLAQRMSGLDLEDFIEILRNARIPVFITVIKDP
jgi:PaREP6 domain containing protein